MQVKTIWKYSKETEVQRLAQITTQIGKRFYDKNGFLVLPCPIDNNPKAIFLPPLNYPKNLFKKAAKLKLSMPMKIPDELSKTLTELLATTENTRCYTAQKIAWQKVEKKFWKTLNDFIPESKNIKSLEIWPTRFGSICSFFWKKKDKVYIWLRLDAAISHITEGIISSLLDKNYAWSEKEAITDFLLTQAALKNFFPNYQATLSALRLKNTRLKKESDKYLKSLGIKIGEIFKIKSGKIYCNSKLLPLGLFSKKETKLLKLFIENKNQIVNFDQTASVLWGKNNEDKFSLWAISKTIERLRKKLKKLNISPDLLQTKRSQGYFLVD